MICCPIPKENPSVLLPDWILLPSTRGGKNPGKGNEFYKRNSHGSSMDAYLDEWQRAYCVNVLTLLQSARETQDRFSPSLERNQMSSISRFIIPGWRSQERSFLQQRRSHPGKCTGSEADGTPPTGKGGILQQRGRLTPLSCFSFGLQHFFPTSLLISSPLREQPVVPLHFLLPSSMPVSPRKTFKTLHMNDKIN